MEPKLDSKIRESRARELAAEDGVDYDRSTKPIQRKYRKKAQEQVSEFSYDEMCAGQMIFAELVASSPSHRQ